LYVGIYLHSSDNPAARILQEYAPMKLWGAEQFKDNWAVYQGSGGRKHLQTPPPRAHRFDAGRSGSCGPTNGRRTNDSAQLIGCGASRYLLPLGRCEAESNFSHCIRLKQWFPPKATQTAIDRLLFSSLLHSDISVKCEGASRQSHFESG